MSVIPPQTRRVILIQSPLGRPETPVYPLGLAILAATLPPDDHLTILDPNRMGESETFSVIRQVQPHIIGVSLRNIDSQMLRDLYYYYTHFRRFLREIRSAAPDAVIIAGGSGFSLFPRAIMEQNPDLDFGVYLESEDSFPELLRNLASPETVQGVFYRRDGSVVFTGVRTYPAMDAIPVPRYDLLSPKPYEQHGGVGVQTKRGCPLTCIYCTYPHLNGRCYRFRPVEDILRELNILYHQYGVREITFVDGVFNLPKERTETLITAMRAQKLEFKWNAWFSELNFDENFAEMCRDSGCTEFSFSPDGFSPETLSALGKSISVSDIQSVYRVARNTPGIRVAFNFFWNPPEQTLGTFFRMLMFALKCKIRLGKRAGGIIFGNMRIEPDTPLWHRAVEDGVISDETDLLPADLPALRHTFYSNPATRVLDVLFGIYSGVWRLKNRLKR